MSSVEGCEEWRAACLGQWRDHWPLPGTIGQLSPPVSRILNASAPVCRYPVCRYLLVDIPVCPYMMWCGVKGGVTELWYLVFDFS